MSFTPKLRRKVVGERVVRARLPAVRPRRLRRPAEGGHPTRRLVLAGDGIRIDLPVALMERAATTGWSAANRLLSDSASRAMTCRLCRPQADRRY